MAARKGSSRKGAGKKSAQTARKTAKTVTPPEATRGSFMVGGKVPRQGGRRGGNNRTGNR